MYGFVCVFSRSGGGSDRGTGGAGQTVVEEMPGGAENQPVCPGSYLAIDSSSFRQFECWSSNNQSGHLMGSTAGNAGSGNCAGGRECLAGIWAGGSIFSLAAIGVDDGSGQRSGGGGRGKTRG